MHHVSSPTDCTVPLQVWFKNRRAKCRQQQKAAQQVNKTFTTHVHNQQQQQRPSSAGSVSNSSATGGVRLPVAAAAASVNCDVGAVTSAAASDDDLDDDGLIYRYHGSAATSGGLLVASSAARPSCGWVPASLFRQSSSDSFAGPNRVGGRLYAGPAGYSSAAAAAAMFACKTGDGSGYPSSPYGNELVGYGTGGWSVSVTQDAYCNGSGGGSEVGGVQFAPAVGSTTMPYGTAAVPVPLFVAAPYDHDSHHHHTQHYHHLPPPPHHHQQQQQQHRQQLEDDDVDDDAGEFKAQSSRRVTLQSSDDRKDWIKYQPL